MVFSSVGYFVFLGILITFFAIVKDRRIQKIALLGASYYFYSQWDWRFLFLLVGLTISTFLCVDRMRKRPDQKVFWLVSSLIVSLGTLAYFKYANFFLGSIGSALRIHLNLLDVILPVGISFIVFEVISYAVDVFRGENEYEANILDFSLLVAFFPHLISGPILKPNHFLPQLKRPITIKLSNLSAGSQLFLWGLMKKILVADRVAPFVDIVFKHPSSFGPVTVWLGVLAYAVQIYGDFSGYTDTAIGSAKCLGFDIPQNFNLPYLATNVSDFWRRWHISLSTWLRNYLYIPLGGNRQGKWRTYVNLAIVMLLGGLWHGASWNFCLWGGIHGIGLAIHKLFRDHHVPTGKPSPAILILNWALTFLFVITAWVPFRSANWTSSIEILRKMYGFDSGERIHWIGTAMVLAVPCLIIADFGSRAWFSDRRLHLTRFSHQFAFFSVMIGILVLSPPASSPFIYFRF